MQRKRIARYIGDDILIQSAVSRYVRRLRYCLIRTTDDVELLQLRGGTWRYFDNFIAAKIAMFIVEDVSAQHHPEQRLTHFWPNCEGYAHHVFFRPLKDVGGDWYSASNHNGALWIAVVDVAGKGRHARILAGNLSTVWRLQESRKARERGNVAELMRVMNREILQCFDADAFAAAVVARCLPSGNVTVGFAGDATAYSFSTGSELPSAYLTMSSRPLGMDNEIEIVQREITLPPGAEILLATDGLTEQARSVVHAGSDNLRQFVKWSARRQPVIRRMMQWFASLRNKATTSMPLAAQRIEKLLEAVFAKHKQLDDITIVSVRRRSAHDGA